MSQQVRNHLKFEVIIKFKMRFKQQQILKLAEFL